MDLKVRQELERAGLELDWPERLQVPIEFGEQGQALPLGEEVPVVDESWTMAHVKLAPISRLWTATDMTPLPLKTPAHHEPFLLLLESTAGIYCTAMNQSETDDEFERLYRLLRHNPDGEDAHPLFSYLQGAARLYLSLRSVSRTEYEALTYRLGRMARGVRSHEHSTNYHRRVVISVLGP
ncbi:hypothetical protein ATI61_102284 [Archangium gephyra]|uniref:Uncharacterized protein n=1 Tax=Archangium gephyra TaxID=48 RepID=A0AAC8QD09_9BACT|nr:hypothetical protein [Archangium gephyra]AKJ05216.1 Hypothetical protein AA314_06842 [Archangium gephyra]REG35910.1 hypothetical protein ATI61_102284 [Archangium gephyra]